MFWGIPPPSLLSLLYPKVFYFIRQSQWHRLHDSPAKHTIVSFVLFLLSLHYSYGAVYSVGVAYFLSGSWSVLIFIVRR